MTRQRMKRCILITIDMMIVLISGLCALAMRFDITQIPMGYLDTMLRFMPLDMLLTVCIFRLFHLYHGVWTFVSISDVVRAMEAVVVVNLVETFYKLMLQVNMPRSYYLLNMLFLFVLAVGSRMSLRVFNYYRSRFLCPKDQRRTMIIGAGSAGNILIHELYRNKHCDNKVVCVIDDNVDKKNKYIGGIKIIGDRWMIKEAIKEYEIEEIIIAIPSAKPQDKSEIIGLCSGTRCRVRILPEISSTLTGMMSQNLREVNLQDLIGRESVKVNEEGIQSFIAGEVVLVTGGGGSIGSELCRQVMAQGPKQLVVFDIYENNAYDLQQELGRKYGTDRLRVLIGSVRDYDKLKAVFEEYRPAIVYHAAAHKHVPLMEDSPCEAVKNNCLGTLNAARLADEYKAKDFVLISTDKAVRPTNVMGATKRICEMIVQCYARKSVTHFAAVRFGNVLGSSGSVVPLFLKQIEEGGPVTVTHRDITRFFMTIPEAVSLVLQASLYACGGEIFVLDMGKPVRIYDLAESLIRMQGYTPDRDIEIKIVGLRPGEKLHEEILMDEEGLHRTENELIHIGRPIPMDAGRFRIDLDALIEAAFQNDSQIKERVAQMCPGYVITENNEKSLAENENLDFVEDRGLVVSGDLNSVEILEEEAPLATGEFLGKGEKAVGIA
ncbi:UDP-glucose 4-epimerase [uncultured Eubacterium sp.]|nr:UDP-glucose 4-epimerase [uncultured Eubacterium sp.]